MKVKLKKKLSKNFKIKDDYFILEHCYEDYFPVDQLGKKRKVILTDCYNTVKLDFEERYVNIKALTKKSQKKVLKKFGHWDLVILSDQEIYINKTLDKIQMNEDSFKISDLSKINKKLKS